MQKTLSYIWANTVSDKKRKPEPYLPEKTDGVKADFSLITYLKHHEGMNRSGHVLMPH